MPSKIPNRQKQKAQGLRPALSKVPEATDGFAICLAVRVHVQRLVAKVQVPFRRRTGSGLGRTPPIAVTTDKGELSNSDNSGVPLNRAKENPIMIIRECFRIQSQSAISKSVFLLNPVSRNQRVAGL